MTPLWRLLRIAMVGLSILVVERPFTTASAHSPDQAKAAKPSHTAKLSERPMVTETVWDFTLTSHHGDNRKVSLQDYRGKVVLLTFGYTHCPDVCPMMLSRLKQLQGRLGNRHQEVQTLFITFDPERDTPARLQTYLALFDATFVGLTGTAKDIGAIARQYLTSFEKLDGTLAAGYLYDHSDYIYLIDREGRLRRRYRSEAPLKIIANDIKHLLTSSASP
jgi:protein SCO1/2